MDIAAMSTTLNQNNIQQQASLSVMKMAMGVADANGDLIASLASQTTEATESSVRPHLGTALDIRV